MRLPSIWLWLCQLVNRLQRQGKQVSRQGVRRLAGGKQLSRTAERIRLRHEHCWPAGCCRHHRGRRRLHPQLHVVLLQLQQLVHAPPPAPDGIWAPFKGSGPNMLTCCCTAALQRDIWRLSASILRPAAMLMSTAPAKPA